MRTNRCKFLVGFLGVVILLMFALGGQPVQFAHADVGVHPLLPGGSSLKPEEDTPIVMQAEKVVITVREGTEADNTAIELNPQAYGLQQQSIWYEAVAEVQADFVMKNPASEEINMPVWFPLASAIESLSWELNPDEIVPRIANFRVEVNGKSLEYAVSELPNPKGADRPLLPWASFPVTFPAGAETKIRVRYIVPLQLAVKGYGMAVYYIFQTGAGWAGTIGQAELELNLPYPATEETVAGITPGELKPPYYMKSQSSLPAGAEINGKQIRWLWKDLEPGPQDDFEVYLMQINTWKELASARAAVQSAPQEAQAWWNLAFLYHRLATPGYGNRLGTMGTAFQPQAIEAYQKVVELWPENPSAHTGLALLALAPYMESKDAPADVLQYVLDEQKIANKLAAQNPQLVWGMPYTLEDALMDYNRNAATQTAEMAAWSTRWAKETLAVLAQTPSPEPTSTPKPTLTASPQSTLEPTIAPPAVEGREPGRAFRDGIPLSIIIAAGAAVLIVIGLVAVVYQRKNSR